MLLFLLQILSDKTLTIQYLLYLYNTCTFTILVKKSILANLKKKDLFYTLERIYEQLL